LILRVGHNGNRRIGDRQQHLQGEGRAFSRFALDTDPAAHRDRQLLADGQAQA
jgi:hypothetical protein